MEYKVNRLSVLISVWFYCTDVQMYCIDVNRFVLFKKKLWYISIFIKEGKELLRPHTQASSYTANLITNCCFLSQQGNKLVFESLMKTEMCSLPLKLVSQLISYFLSLFQLKQLQTLSPSKSQSSTDQSMAHFCIVQSKVNSARLLHFVAKGNT